MNDSSAIAENQQKAIISWLPYQKKLLDDDARLIVSCWSRQTGKSFTNGAKILKDIVQAEAEGKKRLWTVGSRGERQAKDLMRDTLRPMVEAFQVLYKSKTGCEIQESSVKTADEGWKFGTSEIEFPGGSRITAIPALPQTMRGRTTSIFLDEMAFHDDGGTEIWRAAFPIISSRKSLKMMVASTPNGMNNQFAKFVKGDAEAKMWSRHITDIYQAVKQGLDRDIEFLKTAAGDERLWAQEFELDFTDEAAIFLPYELILPCESKDAGKPHLYNGGLCYVGVDIGRHKHLFVVTVLEKITKNLFIVREVYEASGITFQQQDAVMDRIMNQYKVAACRVDETGIGARSAETYRNKYGSRCEGLVFTVNSKHDMASYLKRLLQEKSLFIPDNINYREDLHSVEQRSLPSGAFVYSSPTVNGSHADRFWSLGLACEAANRPAMPFQVDARQARPTHSRYGYGL